MAEPKLSTPDENNPTTTTQEGQRWTICPGCGEPEREACSQCRDEAGLPLSAIEVIPADPNLVRLTEDDVEQKKSRMKVSIALDRAGRELLYAANEASLFDLALEESLDKLRAALTQLQDRD